MARHRLSPGARRLAHAQKRAQLTHQCGRNLGRMCRTGATVSAIGPVLFMDVSRPAGQTHTMSAAAREDRPLRPAVLPLTLVATGWWTECERLGVVAVRDDHEVAPDLPTHVFAGPSDNGAPPRHFDQGDP